MISIWAREKPIHQSLSPYSLSPKFQILKISFIYEDCRKLDFVSGFQVEELIYPPHIARNNFPSHKNCTGKQFRESEKNGCSFLCSRWFMNPKTAIEAHNTNFMIIEFP